MKVQKIVLVVPLFISIFSTDIFSVRTIRSVSKYDKPEYDKYINPEVLWHPTWTAGETVVWNLAYPAPSSLTTISDCRSKIKKDQTRPTSKGIEKKSKIRQRRANQEKLEYYQVRAKLLRELEELMPFPHGTQKDIVENITNTIRISRGMGVLKRPKIKEIYSVQFSRFFKEFDQLFPQKNLSRNEKLQLVIIDTRRLKSR